MKNLHDKLTIDKANQTLERNGNTIIKNYTLEMTVNW